MAGKSKSKFSSPPVILLNLEEDEQLFSGIHERASSHGWLILDLRITCYSINPETNVIGYFTDKHIVEDPFINDFRDKGIPVIRLGSDPDKTYDKIIPSIVFDSVKAGELAADHFADRNFKVLGFVGNYPWFGHPYLYNAFHERALKRGLECNLLQIKSPSPQLSDLEKLKEKVKQIKKWLPTLPKPIGLFTYHDLNASIIYTTAKDMGLEVPEDVAILGMENRKTICNFLPVPLSSIDLNAETKGRQAVDLLYGLINGKEIQKSAILIPPIGIIERQSTNLLSVPDPVVARALRFLWDNFAEQISVDDVALSTGVAKSTLIRKFRKNLNHGVNFELRRKRFEHCCKLLRGTQMTIEEVANSSGFPSLPYFYIAFKEFHGMTPRNYRRKMTRP